MQAKSFACLIFAAIAAPPLGLPVAAKPNLVAQMQKSIERDPASTIGFGRDVKLEDVGKICNAQQCYEIGTYIWQTETHRSIRLLVFGIEHGALTYLGGYGQVDRPVAITGTKVIFPFAPEWGNEIDFSAGPPQKAWLDGYNPEFFK